ncbi:hypothetical protein I2487_02215 [Nesterenkonia sp. E16_10]|uniref:hypothetical protein n=1 Tax=Nesterenkonia sp. E16_10 TaxID=2789296 RepID=UPI001A926955|nr:hypothetical protein [Nesterenkonia sp. E16_10]MBO0594465.1 hypothetical protein [Nesterenkonia sp. E16_10]
MGVGVGIGRRRALGGHLWGVDLGDHLLAQARRRGHRGPGAKVAAQHAAELPQLAQLSGKLRVLGAHRVQLLALGRAEVIGGCGAEQLGATLGGVCRIGFGAGTGVGVVVVGAHDSASISSIARRRARSP